MMPQTRFLNGQRTRVRRFWGAGTHLSRRLLFLIASVVTCLVLFAPNVHPAFAVQAKPPTDKSYYITTTSTSSAYNLGCNQGTLDASFSPPVNSEVVLDFGGQNSSGTGTLLINGTSITNAQIESVAEQFSSGYWNCTGNDSTSKVTLGIGTNNSYYDVSSSGGNAWAQVISAVINSNKSSGYDAQVVIDGANDMEPDFGSASGTIAWAQGYANVFPAPYINYGSADGCPSSSSANGSCNNGWNQYDVWYVSWGSPPAKPLPEIYYSVQAQQWTMISLYGAQSQNKVVRMQGPLDEYDLDSSTDTSAQAWSQLWTDLNTYSTTAQNMNYSAEIANE
ncbi:MAG TPA: hypothetical protein VKX46_13280 [Ktedonobacteraceae bacterium]|nr:hypothetical protein [Ktedonobacteraceae bacterium]